ncbi:MAG: mechanosensitive ion channel [Planctomycetia bacterium]|nr:mechanosensitive ion channel [Planctomycetia bacterium]
MSVPPLLPPPVVLAALALWSPDVELQRKLIVAIAAWLVASVTLPRGRRQFAIWPLVLMALAPLPFLASLIFPESPGAPELAVDGARFFLLASLLQSILLVLGVSLWERFAKPMPRIFLDVFRWLMLAAALVAILYESGVNAGNLFTGSALVTAALGFALKDTLGNVFSGLAIHAEHPFEVGDWIQYDQNQAHIGRVVEINWRATKVITLDEAYVIIPNGQLAQASIRNFTKPEPWSRRSLFVITPYHVPPQRVQAIILEAIRGSFGVLEHPAASVVTNDFKERGVEYWVRLFTTEFDKRDRVDGMARDRIWYALSRQGIEIPVATHAVRLTELPAAVPEAPEATIERRIECLTRVGLLASLDAGQVRRLASDNAERLYAAGEQVVRQGAAGESLFVILAGRVEVSVREGDKPAVRLAVLGSGDYFGEMSLMTGAARLATVTTLEETRLLEICKDSFGRILAEKPGLIEQVGAALRERLADRSRAIAGQESPPPEPAQDIFARIRDFFSM